MNLLPCYPQLVRDDYRIKFVANNFDAHVETMTNVGSHMGQAMVEIDVENCTGCDLCITHCPFEALLPLENCPPGYRKRPVVVVPENCVGCLSCIGSCPIDVLTEIKVPPKSNFSPLIVSDLERQNVIRIDRWGKNGQWNA